MDGWLTATIIVACVIIAGVVAQKMDWIDLTNKSKSGGSGGGAAIGGIGDEVFHPTRHEAQVELDRQSVLPATAPLAGDGDKGIYSGTVRIDLSAERGSAF